MYRAREQTPEDGLRRLSVREEPHRGQQRNSYSGPASDYYRERQERDYYQPAQQHHQVTVHYYYILLTTTTTTSNNSLDNI